MATEESATGMASGTTLTSRGSGPRCRRLRWKGMFIEVEPDPEVPTSTDGLCWCSRTQTCLGPDGGVVEGDKCGPHRECFEALGGRG